MSTATTPTAAEAELAVQARQAVAKSDGYWAGVWKRVRRDPVTIASSISSRIEAQAMVTGSRRTRFQTPAQ